MSHDVTLYTGDCAQVMREHLADGSIDLTVTSPPYDNLRTYKGFTFDFEAIAAQLWRVTKPGGVVVWVVADATINGSETGTSFRQALHFMGLGFNLETMIWNKPPQGANGSSWYYAQSHEYMFVLAKGRPNTINKIKDRANSGLGRKYEKTRGGRNTKIGAKKTGEVFTVDEFGYRTNVWNVIKESSGNPHPAPFSEALARDHIASWSNPGDVVLDPMCGSGTTLKMAVLSGRKAIGIDIASEYIELSRERVARAQLQMPLSFDVAPGACDKTGISQLGFLDDSLPQPMQTHGRA